MRIRYNLAFTLIELLISLAIISIIISMAVLSIRTASPEEDLKDFAQKMANKMEYAMERAELSMTSYGITFNDENYYFVVLDENNKWQVLSDSKYLKLQNLEKKYIITAEYPSGELNFKTKADDEEIDIFGKKDDKEEKPIEPRIYFFADGEFMPDFILHIVDNDNEIEATIEPDEYKLFKITTDDIL
ncbi:MAG: type II secretion system protein GspH [Gammaproteobacteria bacterium]|nr:MAG: type II secretion system protein GspH [Gammaproteobacteria bacterium]